MTAVPIELTTAPAVPPTEPPVTGPPVTIDVPDDACVCAATPLGRALARRRAELAAPGDVVVTHDSML